MFETSRDILNIVLSVSVAVFTFFLCWSLYYVVASFREIFKATREVQESVKKIEDLIDTIKNKVTGGFSNLMAMGEVMKRVMDFVKEKKRGMDDRKREKEERRYEEEKRYNSEKRDADRENEEREERE
ncbi:MAG: hypothetical protein MUF50_00430 [Planctomycetes bacterium]|jgi:hypothetical protein|nr:hypothetical protein [Planctomycetota bacterium]